jgi:hypothetical protein
MTYFQKTKFQEAEFSQFRGLREITIAGTDY